MLKQDINFYERLYLKFLQSILWIFNGKLKNFHPSIFNILLQFKEK